MFLLDISIHCRALPRHALPPSVPHLFLLPFSLGLDLFQLLRLLLGKAHGLCREEVLKAFEATVFFFCRSRKGEEKPSVSLSQKQGHRAMRPLHHHMPHHSHVTTVMSALVDGTGHLPSLTFPSLFRKMGE